MVSVDVAHQDVGIIIPAGCCLLEPVQSRCEIAAHAAAFHVDLADKRFRRSVILISASLQKIQPILAFREKRNPTEEESSLISVVPVLFEEPFADRRDLIGRVKPVHMVAVSLPAAVCVCRNHGSSGKPDEIDRFPFAVERLHSGVLRGKGEAGRKLRLTDIRAFLLKHCAERCHPNRGFRVPGGSHIGEMIRGERLQELRTPLARHHQRTRKEIRVHGVEVEGEHSAHRLARRIDAVPIDVIAMHDGFQKPVRDHRFGRNR